MKDDCDHGNGNFFICVYRQAEAPSVKHQEHDGTAKQNRMRIIADVFGDASARDSSCSGSGQDGQSHEALQQILVQPAGAMTHGPANGNGNDNDLSNPSDLHGKGPGPAKMIHSALGKAMKDTAEEAHHHSTRGQKAQGGVKACQPPAASQGKQKARGVLVAGESARPAKRKHHIVAAARAPVCAAEASPDEHSAGLSSKKVENTKDTKRPRTRQQKRANLQSDAVNWKAYADALDVRLAEAEVLLADDSE